MVLLVMFCRSGNSGLQADPVLSGVSGCCQNRAGTYRIKAERWAQELTWWSCFSAIEADEMVMMVVMMMTMMLMLITMIKVMMRVTVVMMVMMTLMTTFSPCSGNVLLLLVTMVMMMMTAKQTLSSDDDDDGDGKCVIRQVFIVVRQGRG